MKINTILLVIISFSIFQYSCKNQKENLNEFSLKKDTIISQFSDSSFFSDIRSMYFDKYLYVTDYKRDQIIILDKKGKFVKCLGRKGRGPGEFQGSSHIYVHNDTLFVANEWKKSIEIFCFENYIKTLHLPQQIPIHLNYRFFERDNKLFLTSFSDTNSIVSFNMNTGLVSHFGSLLKFEAKEQSSIRNNRNLFYHNDFILSVSDNMPIVEKYDYTGKLLEIYDYSEVTIVKQMINFTKSKKLAINSYYKLVTDAYLKDDKLYILLLINEKEGITSNTVLEIKVDKKMCSQNLYRLCDGWYSAICIADSSLWAYGQEGLINFHF